jgi:colicin import membrane protein
LVIILKIPYLTPRSYKDEKADKAASEKSETGKTEVEKKQTVTVKEGIEANKLMSKIMKDSQAKKAESSSGKLPTYKQAWEKLSDAAKKKYGTQEEFTKQAKAYNNRGKTEATATIPKEKETVTTETVTNANDISGNTGRNNAAADVLKRAKESAENKKKEEEAKKKAAAAAAEEAKKNKKLTPKEKRKAERNIKAQEKANKKIRKGGGTEIEVDKKNTTATAADRRKLKQGAKRLEQKLSLAQKEIDRKNKKKKEDKNGKDKKEKDNTSKTSKSFI